MKVHIVSFQRTGSKSLQKAIENALPNPLRYHPRHGGQGLNEYFHAWETSGYKFGVNARFPFDPEAEIKFRTAKDFDEFQGKGFVPVDGHTDTLWYAESEYMKDLDASHIRYLRGLLDSFPGRDYVIKSQLTTLVEDVVIDDSRWLHNVIDGHDLTINLVPTDILSWICSNFVCDKTGVFVPCPEQEEAAKGFKGFIKREYVEAQLKRLDKHTQLVANIPNLWTIRTSDLSTPEFQQELANRLGVFPEAVKIEHPKEFSATGYDMLIANYAEIPEMIRAYNAQFVTPITYPV